MKEIYLIAIAFLAPWTVTAIENDTIGTLDFVDFNCPAIDTCPPTLFFHNNDCALFYECKNARPLLRRCLSGLHFSKRWQGCVRPAISECGNGDTRNCRENELSDHECNCYKYYQCKNGWKVLRDCPSGWHFSKKRRVCVEGMDCNEDEENICRDGDRSAHECECDKYYVCKRGQKALRECPSGTHFDRNTLECIWGDCPPETCTEGEQRSHECHCEYYYRCKNNEWVFRECDPGYLFSPSRLTCVPEREADCGDRRSGPGDCPIPTPTGPWHHECDCRLYYTCENGQKEIRSCSWGDYYDRVSSTCNPAKTVTGCSNHWDDWL